jgi:hypothetical protein
VTVLRSVQAQKIPTDNGHLEMARATPSPSCDQNWVRSCFEYERGLSSCDLYLQSDGCLMDYDIRPETEVNGRKAQIASSLQSVWIGVHNLSDLT